MKTALIILNYNNVEDTINCIKSVLKCNTAPIKFVVVDNGSPRAGVVRKLDRFMSETFGSGYTRIQENVSISWPYLNQATLLISKHNDGYACGNNKGLRLVDADPEIDNVMILNNDILFIEDIIDSLLKEKSKLSDCAIISPILYTRDKKDIDINCARKAAKVGFMIKAHLFHYITRLFRIESLLYDYNRYLLASGLPKEKVIPIELPSGSCMLIGKDLFKSIGWFDPHTFLYYEEDILHQKIRNIGLRNYIVCDLCCIHLGGASTASMKGLTTVKASMQSQCYYVENYSGVNFLTKLVYRISLKIFMNSVRLQKKLVKK